MLLEICAVSVGVGTEREILSMWFNTQVCTFFFLSAFSKGDFWEDAVLASEGEDFTNKAKSRHFPADLFHVSSSLQIKMISSDLLSFAHLRKRGR